MELRGRMGEGEPSQLTNKSGALCLHIVATPVPLLPSTPHSPPLSACFIAEPQMTTPLPTTTPPTTTPEPTGKKGLGLHGGQEREGADTESKDPRPDLTKQL